MGDVRCISFVACERIESEGGALSLHRVIDRLEYAKYPAELPQLCVYALLRGFRADARVRVFMRWSSPGSPDEISVMEPLDRMARADSPIDEIPVHHCKVGIVLPGPGLYRFVLEVDGIELVDRVVVAK